MRNLTTSEIYEKTWEFEGKRMIVYNPDDEYLKNKNHWIALLFSKQQGFKNKEDVWNWINRHENYKDTWLIPPEQFTSIIEALKSVDIDDILDALKTNRVKFYEANYVDEDVLSKELSSINPYNHKWIVCYNEANSCEEYDYNSECCKTKNWHEKHPDCWFDNEDEAAEYVEYKNNIFQDVSNKNSSYYSYEYVDFDYLDKAFAFAE